MAPSPFPCLHCVLQPQSPSTFAPPINNKDLPSLPDAKAVPVGSSDDQPPARANLKEKSQSAANFFSAQANPPKREHDSNVKSLKHSAKNPTVAVASPEESKLIFESLSIWRPLPGFTVVGKKLPNGNIEIKWTKKDEILNDYSREVAKNAYHALTRNAKEEVPRKSINQTAPRNTLQSAPAVDAYSLPVSHPEKNSDSKAQASKRGISSPSPSSLRGKRAVEKALHALSKTPTKSALKKPKAVSLPSPPTPIQRASSLPSLLPSQNLNTDKQQTSDFLDNPGSSNLSSLRSQKSTEETRGAQTKNSSKNSLEKLTEIPASTPLSLKGRPKRAVPLPTPTPTQSLSVSSPPVSSHAANSNSARSSSVYRERKRTEEARDTAITSVRKNPPNKPIDRSMLEVPPPSVRARTRAASEPTLTLRRSLGSVHFSAPRTEMSSSSGDSLPTPTSDNIQKSHEKRSFSQSARQLVNKKTAYAQSILTGEYVPQSDAQINNGIDQLLNLMRETEKPAVECLAILQRRNALAAMRKILNDSDQ